MNMFHNDDLNDDNLNSEIKHLQERIDKLIALKLQIATMNLYEVGIRKIDNSLVCFRFSYYNGEGRVAVTIPGKSNETYNITLDTFQLDYVAYSSKTRALFPKRNT